MISVAHIESAALDELEPRWRQQGYTLVRAPSAEQLPGFLRDFRPDAIAIGVKPSLAIEVLRSRGRSADTKVRQLQSLFKGRDDWRLEVVYVSPDGAPLQSVTRSEIESVLHQVRLLVQREPRAALLLAWAALEAVARTLQPELASRSLSPSSLTDLLISHGHLPQTESGKLRRLGEIRNLLAHGQINEEPSVEDVCYLIDRAESLLALNQKSE